MKIFIAQNIEGLPEEQVLQDHEIIVDTLINLFGDEIETTWYYIPSELEHDPVWYWGQGLQAMDGCDLFCDATSLRPEYDVSQSYQIEMIAAEYSKLSILKLQFPPVNVEEISGEDED